MPSRFEEQNSGHYSDQDLLQALGGKYGGGGELIMLLPLDSGRWAIFDVGRDLQDIVAWEKPELEEQLLSIAQQGRRKYEAEKAIRVKTTIETVIQAEKNAEDLGL